MFWVVIYQIYIAIHIIVSSCYFKGSCPLDNYSLFCCHVVNAEELKYLLCTNYVSSCKWGYKDEDMALNLSLHKMFKVVISRKLVVQYDLN